MRVAAAHLGIPVFLCIACAQVPRSDISNLNGEKAMEFVRAQVAFGPRPPGSEALQACRSYIIRQLQGWGYRIEEDAFDAQTPYGIKRMVNLIARRGSGDGPAIAIASHYDTKYMDHNKFVGANDGGSSTGLLLELARVLAPRADTLDYWFVFLDGEEAFIEWSTFDSTYGSRHLAKRWKQEGVSAKVRALILLDMIGDRNLDLARELHSTRWMADMVQQAAANTGLEDSFARSETYIEDDHIPFLDIGIPAIDLIDFDYGPDNSYWHTEEDTLDKLSAESLQRTGRLVLTLLPMLQAKLAGR
jgi:hypothetical protein